MKTLFFLLALINVALFMWEYKAGAFIPATVTSEQNADVGQEQIQLVSELKNVPQAVTPASALEQPVAENASIDKANKSASIPELLPATLENLVKPALEQSTATVSNKSNADKTEAHCFDVGPFATTKIYQTWLTQLKDIESEIKSINRDGKVVSNYIVYYPAAETQIQSEENIKKLRNHGLKDLWILNGEDKGKVSLGLFDREESALAMKNELLAKGIKADIKAQYKTKSQKYAVVKGNGKLVDRLDVLKKTYPELSVKQITDDTQGCW